ncbi:MAG: polysaccharide biosynthesis C-terminal domain-containing protein [Salinivirgaceae bacterium]|nr:polysaccharide biosynthesis C-terminal domain-containing protein [Salinivirgaceae bacterium]
MSFIKKHITNFSALQFIQLLRFATLFCIGIVFSRFYSKADIGSYETLLFVASAVSFFWLRGILQSLLSIIKTDNKKNSDYYNVFVVMTAFSLITIVFLIIFKNSIVKELNNVSSLTYFYLLLIYLFLSTPAYLIEYFYLGLNKPKKILWYGIISYGLQFICLSLPPIFNYPLLYSIIALIAISGFRYLWVLSLVYKYSELKLNLKFVLKHLKLAYPLIASSLLSGSSQYIDGIIVTKMFDTSTFAIFRYGARELPLVFIMTNALSNSLISDFSNYEISVALKKLKKSASILMHFLFPVTIVLLILSNYLFPIMFTQEFSMSAKIFNVYMLLIISRLLFPQTILIGKQYTGVIMKISFVELIVNVSLSIIFVHWIGIIGIALATLIANFLDKVLLIGVVYRKYQIKISQYLSVKWYVIYSLLLIVVYYLVDFVIFT